MDQDSQLANQACTVSIATGPLCPDVSTFLRNRDNSQRPQPAFANKPEMLLKHLDHLVGPLVSRRFYDQTQGRGCW